MLTIDSKFVNLLSSKLRNFKKKGDHLWNFSCPVCGDSKKKKTKARGYIYRPPNKAMLFYKCHNCGASMQFGTLLKSVDQYLYQEYTTERYLTEKPTKYNKAHSEPDLDMFVQPSTPQVQDSFFDDLENCASKNVDSNARKYLINRGFLDAQMEKLWFCGDYKKYCNSVQPNSFSTELPVLSAIIIPFVNEHAKVYGLQGRIIDSNSDLRYHSVHLDKNYPFIYGLDRVNFSEIVLVVEGALDSLFLPNCISVSGSSLNNSYTLGLKSKAILVYDAQPKNKELVKQIKKAINKGFRVALLHSKYGKDINEMILNGLTSNEIVKLIHENTFENLEAHAKLMEWK